MGISTKTLDTLHRGAVKTCIGLSIIGLGLTGIAVYHTLTAPNLDETPKVHKDTEELS